MHLVDRGRTRCLFLLFIFHSLSLQTLYIEHTACTGNVHGASTKPCRPLRKLQQQQYERKYARVNK